MEGFTKLQEWFKSAAGHAILMREEEILTKIISRMFGFHFVICGFPDFLSYLKSSPILHRVFLAFGVQSEFFSKPSELFEAQKILPWCQNIVLTPAASLPFAAESIDVLLLQHSLAFSPDPHALLREASRVLISEGSLIITGFTPKGLWGSRASHKKYQRSNIFSNGLLKLRNFMGAIKKRSNFSYNSNNRFPVDMNLIKASSLVDWLNLLGFAEISVQYYYQYPKFYAYMPIVSDWLYRYHLGFKMGYVIVAKKRQLIITPLVSTARSHNRLVITGLAEV